MSNITLKLANFCLPALLFISIINKSFLHEHVVWYVIQQTQFIKFPKFISQGH